MTAALQQALQQEFQQVRAASEQFCQPLELEDYGLQATPFTSPPKWHLAHTSWFFETFVLKPYQPNFAAFSVDFEVLFNSYYNGIGAQHPRAERGLLSRPSLAEVRAYRKNVNEAVAELLSDEGHTHAAQIRALVELGINHEQQHQELFFTDIKYSLSRNTLCPAYLSAQLEKSTAAVGLDWRRYEGGEFTVGHQGQGFCFDNEQPVHPVLLQPYALANRLVTNGEYLQFIEEQGYQRPELWLSDGWTTVCENQWQHPLYWRTVDGVWQEYSLYGLQELDLQRPASHLSAYEADAYARWAGARLPTEFEWEAAAAGHSPQGQFVESGELHPRACTAESDAQMYGGLWQWTSSAYGPYPGYVPAAGAVGEYNGKFMANQLVLRGGSCVTAQSHIRSSYRNFFYPPDRWQFTGVRLAKWL
jgi:ergothioneine biosynthesis protein EgtB